MFTSVAISEPSNVAATFFLTLVLVLVAAVAVTAAVSATGGNHCFKNILSCAS